MSRVRQRSSGWRTRLIVSLRPPIRRTIATAQSRASDWSPSEGWPPTHWAAKTSTPSKRVNAGRIHLLRGAVDMEDLLDAVVEVASERDCEGERGGVALRLDCVDGLAGDAERLAEFGLREAAVGS